MRVLAIETSCDETAGAIIEWADNRASVLANVVSSQATLHAKWGGVVPALASREHMRSIVPVVEETLTQAGIESSDIDLITVTEGPGLMPALIIGVSAAKTLALVWNKPLIGINHLEGHIYANFLNSQTTNHQLLTTNPETLFPLLALIVSGGHTELVLMQKHFDYTVLGETQDDASGEAFDKVAKLLGLSYPGGPIVAKRADEYRITPNYQLPTTSSLFPRPMINSDDFNFSFSGLKTSVLYYLKKHEDKKNDGPFISMICHEFQEAVVDVLVAKTKKALALYSPQTLVIAGGVSANVRLRARLQETIDTLNLAVSPLSEKIAFLTPEFAYSLDNAAMIGVAAAMRYDHMDEKQKMELHYTAMTLDPDANLALE
jgi:N6-L-threonylcarbamoyladenine synthase